MRDMTREQRARFRRERTEAREQLTAAVNEATEKVIRDFERQLRQQIEVARTITRLSPVAAFVYANTDIGETGVRHERRLVNGLREYQHQFARYVAEKQEGSSGGSDFGFGEEEDYDIEDLPVFQQREDALSARLAARSIDILLLAVFAILFFMAAFVSFLRTDIT